MGRVYSMKPLPQMFAFEQDPRWRNLCRSVDGEKRCYSAGGVIFLLPFLVGFSYFRRGTRWRHIYPSARVTAAKNASFFSRRCSPPLLTLRWSSPEEEWLWRHCMLQPVAARSSRAVDVVVVRGRRTGMRRGSRRAGRRRHAGYDFVCENSSSENFGDSVEW
ncbi:unnamed protein product, partial [Ectocarpus sp. 12 AP-2014]